MNKLIDFITKSIKSQFGKNFLSLTLGTGLSHLVPFLFLPVIGRLYEIQTFGEYGKYIVLIGLLGVGSTGRLELAVVAEQNTGNRFKLFNLSVLFSITSLLLISVFFYIIPFEDILKRFSLNKYLHVLNIRRFIIPGIFLFSLNQIQTSFFTSWKMFSFVSRQRLLQSTATALGMLGFGTFFSTTVYSLIYASLSSLFLVNLVYFIKWIDLYNNLGVNKGDKTYKELLIYYRNFPIFSSPMGMINYFCSSILSFFFMIFNLNTMLGFLVQTEKIVKAPLNILSNSLSHVFYQKISEYNNKSKELYLYTRVSAALFITNIIVLSPLFFWGEEIFSLILGEKWALAGRIAALLLPLYCLTTVISSVSNTYGKYRMNHLSLIWQIMYFFLLASFLFFYGKQFLEEDFSLFFYIYSFCAGVMYFIFWLGGYYIIKIKAK